MPRSLSCLSHPGLCKSSPSSTAVFRFKSIQIFTRFDRHFEDKTSGCSGHIKSLPRISKLLVSRCTELYRGDMKSTPLKTFVKLRTSLLRQKAELEARLAEINEALGMNQETCGEAAPGGAVTKTRSRNPISLRSAVIEVTRAEPLSKAQILTAVKKIGYKFGVPNPLPSLNTVLYTNPKFKKIGGKFSPPDE